MLLTLSWTLPLAGAILLALIGNADGRRDAMIRWVALAVSLVVLAVTLLIWARFDPASADFQFVERVAWIPAFGIDVGVIDGAVNGVATIVDAGSMVLRRLQTGSVRAYAESLFIGVVLMLGYYLWR